MYSSFWVKVPLVKLFLCTVTSVTTLHFECNINNIWKCVYAEYVCIFCFFTTLMSFSYTLVYCRAAVTGEFPWFVISKVNLILFYFQMMKQYSNTVSLVSRVLPNFSPWKLTKNVRIWCGRNAKSENKCKTSMKVQSLSSYALIYSSWSHEPLWLKLRVEVCSPSFPPKKTKGCWRSGLDAILVFIQHNNKCHFHI